MSEITPVTHTEKVVAGQVDAVTHFEKVIAKYGGGNVYENLEAGTNILIEETSDGKAKISASGEVSSEDTVARAEIAEMKDGTNIDSFGDVETALIGKADTTDIPTVPITAIQKNGTGITPVSGTVNITVPTQASDINAATATQGGKADTAIQGIKVNSSTVNPDANKVVNITVPTSAADVSALPNTTKYAAALSLTINSSTFVMTGQLKDQNGDNLGRAQTIDLPLESVVVNGSYDSQTKKVVLTLQNGNTIEFSVADLVSGLQTELSASNKLNPAYINYDSTHAAVTEAQREQIETNKNNILTLTPTVQQAVSANLTSDYTLITSLNTVIARRVGGSAAINRVTAFAEGGSIGVRGIIISKSDDSTAFDNSVNMLAKIEQETGVMGALSISCIYYNGANNSDVPIYIWVKGAATGTARTYSINERLRD